MMGLIFDKNTAGNYESWCRSPEGRAITKSVEELLVDLLDPKPGERVLDIGCGSGNHLLFLSKLGLNVSGIDASPYMVSRAAKRLGNRCPLKIGMAEDLPFDDNEFDLAVLINTLEFLDDPFLALREAGRVTNRKIFIGVMNSLSWNFLSKRIRGFLEEGLFSHARFFSLWKLKFMLEGAFGRAPVSWRCTQIYPSFMEKSGLVGSKEFWNSRRSPFGSFLGLSVSMAYQLKTDNLPLKIRVKKPSPVIGGQTLEDLHRSGDVHRDEKTLAA